MDSLDYNEALKLYEEHSFEILLTATVLRANPQDRNRLSESFPYEYELIMNAKREDLRRYTGIGL